MVSLGHDELTHWGRVTHICVGKLTNIGSDNGLSPGRRQAIIWTNAGISLIGPLGTNFSEILIGIQTFSFKKMHLEMSSAKWRPFCLGLNELTQTTLTMKLTLNLNQLYENLNSFWVMINTNCFDNKIDLKFKFMVRNLAMVISVLRPWRGSIHLWVTTRLRPDRLASHWLGVVLLRNILHAETLPWKSSFLLPLLCVLYNMVS